LKSVLNKYRLFPIAYIFAFTFIVQPNLWSQQAIVDGNYLIGYSVYGHRSLLAFPIEFTYSWVRTPSIVSDYYLSRILGETGGYLAMRIIPLLLIVVIAGRIAFLRKWENGFMFIVSPLFLTPNFWQVIGNDYHYGLATLAVVITALLWILVNLETSKRNIRIANYSLGLFVAIMLFSGSGIPFIFSFAFAALILSKDQIKHTFSFFLRIFLSTSLFVVIFSLLSGFYFGHFNPIGALLRWTNFYSKSGIWEYWNTSGFSWLNYSPSLLVFPILLFGIHALRKSETDLQVQRTSDFLTISFIPLFIYYFVSQFILSKTMGLFELSFQVIMLLALPLLNFGILTASKFDGSRSYEVFYILILVFLALQLLPRYKFLILWNGIAISCVTIFLISSFARSNLIKKRKKNSQIVKNQKVLRIQLVSWASFLALLALLAFGHTSSVIPNAANISTPDYSRVFGFTDQNYRDWKRDVLLANWAFNVNTNSTELRSYTWLLPRKQGVNYVRFSNSAWSAAGTLMWGNSQYTVNNSSFGSGNLDPEFYNQVNAQGKVTVFVVGDNKKSVSITREDINGSDIRIDSQVCKDFKNGVSPIHVCKFTLIKN